MSSFRPFINQFRNDKQLLLMVKHLISLAESTTATLNVGYVLYVMRSCIHLIIFSTFIVLRFFHLLSISLFAMVGYECSGITRATCR